LHVGSNTSSLSRSIYLSEILLQGRTASNSKRADYYISEVARFLRLELRLQLPKIAFTGFFLVKACISVQRQGKTGKIFFALL
jgi:hypothetical protein